MTMLGAVSPDLEQFVEQEVASGRFSSREAVISHALRLLQRDREEVIAGILAGLADVAEGKTTPVGQAFSELRAELGISKDE